MEEPAAKPKGAVPVVIFPHWREGLNQVALSPNARAGYALAIGGYLDYCRRTGWSVSLESARAFMAEAQRRQLARNPQLWKEALNWFFREGRQHSGLTAGGLPSPGQADTGRTPWERRQVVVRSGKGDKDRVTVLPESLVERLQAHRDRVREAARGGPRGGVGGSVKRQTQGDAESQTEEIRNLGFELSRGQEGCWCVWGWQGWMKMTWSQGRRWTAGLVWKKG